MLRPSRPCSFCTFACAWRNSAARRDDRARSSCNCKRRAQPLLSSSALEKKLPCLQLCSQRAHVRLQQPPSPSGRGPSAGPRGQGRAAAVAETEEASHVVSSDDSAKALSRDPPKGACAVRARRVQSSPSSVRLPELGAAKKQKSLRNISHVPSCGSPGSRRFVERS